MSSSFEHSHTSVKVEAAHDGPVYSYDKAPGHRWYNKTDGIGPELTVEELERFESDPTVLIPDFEKLPYPGEDVNDRGFLRGRVPVVGKEGYQEISLNMYRYSGIVQAVHRAIHKLRPAHKLVAGRVVTNH